jgi:putative flippase GtrA
LKQFFEKFLKFGVVGVANTVIAYVVYATLVALGLYYLLSSVISFAVSMVNAFYWNNKYVFHENKESRNAMGSAFRMVASYVFSSLIIGNILLYTFVDIFEISAFIAPFFGLCVTVPLNFVLNRFWVFR